MLTKIESCEDCIEWRDMYLILLEEYLLIGKGVSMQLETEERLEKIRTQGNGEREKQ